MRGTGKSYLVNAIVDNFGFKDEEIAFATFTGKAALVLRQQGKNAITLHKLLYKARPNGFGGYTFIPKTELDEKYKLIIVDEISMCPKEMWKLLLSHSIYIIGLGDPFQLPPINQDDDNHLLENPHIFLTEIIRQALDNDIIKYSLDLREGRNLPMNLDGKNIRTYPKIELSDGMMQWADQILCGKNITRKTLNNRMRKILGYESFIEVGDKLICLKNYWEKTSNCEDPLVNGYIGKVIKNNINEFTGSNKIDFGEEDNLFTNVQIDQKLLKTGISYEQQFWKDIKSGKIPRSRIKNRPEFIELDYGYAITVHKSQGSQFNKVLIYDEVMGDELYHRRWLYTAITRSTDKVVVLI